MGIPTYDPAEPIGDRWIKKFRIKETVFNFGINYPSKRICNRLRVL